MRFRKLLFALFLTIALSLTASALDWQVTSTGELTTDFGPVTKICSVADTDYGKLFDKCYSYPDGAYFSSKKLVADTAVRSNSSVLDSFDVECTSLYVKSYNSTTGKWVNGYVQGTRTFDFGMYFIRIDGKSDMIICLPQAYISRENDCLEALPDQTGKLKISPTLTGWKISILSPRTYSPCSIEYFVLKSDNQLIDWSINLAENVWSGYQLTGDNRWCYNGYYYTCPSNYIPTGENYYYRLPAAYITCKLVPMGLRYDAAKYMCIAMLDTMAGLQNSDGYFPTKAGSQWLADDYGIGAGFYDTRFNTDLVRGFRQAAKNYGIDSFNSVVDKYIKFYLNYAANHHDTITLSDGSEGWLVHDYWHVSGAKKTHTSLNHQLAEIILLEEYYLSTGNAQALNTESLMFAGIRGTEKAWYKSDSNLEYGWLNGKMLGQDYPYLTYDDLYELDELYYSRLGYHVRVIARLMNSKKKWMVNNGVTGYKGTEAWRELL